MSSLRIVRSLALILLAAGPIAAQELTVDSFGEWRDFLRPAPEELLWTRISWRPAFWSAAIEARRDEKPLLIWAMNGHPLGTT